MVVVLGGGGKLLVNFCSRGVQILKSWSKDDLSWSTTICVWPCATISSSTVTR